MRVQTVRAEPPKRWATARKAFNCRACSRLVAAGTRYWQVAPPFVPATKFCSVECDAARHALFCRDEGAPA